MTNKTTATDWRLVDERGAGGFLYIDRGPDHDFLQVEPEEHARLIAAAPALLAALKDAEKILAQLREAGYSVQIELQDARAAIAAAEAAGVAA